MKFIVGPIYVNICNQSKLGVSIGPTFNKESSIQVDLQLLTNQHTSIHLRGLTAAKKEGKFPQPPAWNLDKEGIVTIEVTPDGATCAVRSSETVGDVTLTVDDIDNPASEPLMFAITVSDRPITQLDATIDDAVDNE